MADRPIIFSAPMIRALLAGTKTQTRRIFGPGTTLFNGRPWSKHQKAQTWGWDEAWVDPGPSPAGNPGPYLKLPWRAGDSDVYEGTAHRVYPRIQPGDRLWVREACCAEELSRPPRERPASKHEARMTKRTHVIVFDELDGADGVRYCADDAWKIIANTPEASERWLSLYHYRRGGKDGVGAKVPPIHMPRWASRLTLLVTDVRVQRVQEISCADVFSEGCRTGVTSATIDGDTEDPRRLFRAVWNSIHGPRAWDRNDWVAAITLDVHRGNIDEMKEALP